MINADEIFKQFRVGENVVTRFEDSELIVIDNGKGMRIFIPIDELIPLVKSLFTVATGEEFTGVSID